MPQFFVDQKCRMHQPVEIKGADAIHISKVLRLKKGDWIVISDSSAENYRCTIVETSKKSVTCLVENKILRPAYRNPPALAIAAIRKDRFEWAIMKAVELGCEKIITFTSERTVTFRSNSIGSKTKRWQKIIIEAAKQSGLRCKPTISPPIGFEEMLSKFKNYSPRLFLYEGENENSMHGTIKAHLDNTSKKSPLLIIGPEGGFTDTEVATAKRSGAISVSLGAQILKVETAAVASIAILQYELGNMNIA